MGQCHNSQHQLTTRQLLFADPSTLLESKAMFVFTIAQINKLPLACKIFRQPITCQSLTANKPQNTLPQPQWTFPPEATAHLIYAPLPPAQYDFRHIIFRLKVCNNSLLYSTNNVLNWYIFPFFFFAGALMMNSQEKNYT